MNRISANRTVALPRLHFRPSYGSRAAISGGAFSPLAQELHRGMELKLGGQAAPGLNGTLPQPTR